MNDLQKENTKKWVAALRSGNFQQGRRCMKCNDFFGNYNFCCLGVACEIQDVPFSTKAGNRGYMFGDLSLNGSPESIWFENTYGFEPSILIEGLRLTEYNDVKRYDFNQIADLIEKEFDL